MLDQFQFLLRIINQGAEVLLLLFAQGVSEKFVHLSLDVSRGISEHMLESLVLSVQVGEEMLRRLRKMKNGLQVDDFSRHLRDGWEITCQQFKVTNVGCDVFIVRSVDFCHIWIAFKYPVCLSEEHIAINGFPGASSGTQFDRSVVPVGGPSFENAADKGDLEAVQALGQGYFGVVGRIAWTRHLRIVDE